MSTAECQGVCGGFAVLQHCGWEKRSNRQDLRDGDGFRGWGRGDIVGQGMRRGCCEDSQRRKERRETVCGGGMSS